VKKQISEVVQGFDKYSDDAMVPESVGDAMLAISEWSRRRHRPLPRYEVAPGIFRNRVGDIRALSRSEAPDSDSTDSVNSA
jgi:hypothetical protein